jgi:hypothetical protein
MRIRESKSPSKSGEMKKTTKCIIGFRLENRNIWMNRKRSVVISRSSSNLKFRLSIVNKKIVA